MNRWLVLAGLILLAFGVQAENLPADQQQGSSLSSSGDPSRGRLIFGPCRSCHSLKRDAGHGFGPNLHRIFGKVAGAQAQFNYYSAGLQAAAFVWTPRRMNEWLAAPETVVPGTTMMSRGVPDAQQRADLIAYLRQASVRDP